MKLGALRSAIRDVKDIYVEAHAVGAPVLVQKTALLKTLGDRFPEGKGSETGLELRPDGLLTYSGRLAEEQVEAAIAAPARSNPYDGRRDPAQVDLEEYLAGQIELGGHDDDDLGDLL